MTDEEFIFNRSGISLAVDWLDRPSEPVRHSLKSSLGSNWSETSVGSRRAIELLAPHVLGGAAHLGERTAFAHMDPPTPWICWAMALWNASLNQNLLHPATAPVAREAEALVIDWLAPTFGMSGGHFTCGSTLANLTALWAAREASGIKVVMAGSGAHVSIAKAAHLLGLDYSELGSRRDGTIDRAALPNNLEKAALVLTAGTTSSGAVDPLELAGAAAWTHVDAAWAGPLRLSKRFRNRLDGIEKADSMAMSAHKWLFQPKDCGLVLFRQAARAHAAITYSADYLTTPGIGIAGSRGAAAIPLLATVLAWGEAGLAARIDSCMGLAERFAAFVHGHPDLELFAEPHSGVILWRTSDPQRQEALAMSLPPGLASTTTMDGVAWLRCVAANPNANLDEITAAICAALGSSQS